MPSIEELSGATQGFIEGIEFHVEDIHAHAQVELMGLKFALREPDHCCSGVSLES